MRTRLQWLIALVAVAPSISCHGGSADDECGSSILGESCAKTADCDCGLRCLDQVCVEVPGGAGSGDTAGAGSGDTAGTGGESNIDAVQACEDLAGAFTERTVACAAQEAGVQLQDDEYQTAYQAAHDAFLLNAVGGSCDRTRSVRDEDVLYTDCLPVLDTVSCNDILAGVVPEACQKQLVTDTR